ncbi:putative nucleoside-diphosphate-sugar epimerase [Candidatus Protochlamydia naegleriophila]|uniref:Putative nucleoside-diphosphate-sugar epimerase n=1 Tax=Candidatus Protochlamydia naegleriophila TaxID=389348 RepID=A0A0U5JI24_9BACT|nr:SDR family oxidoreductase [Candidatus Protochlamydia naegleriophila]CUI17446.1 putative nucleoside-diphosphate-sugar epimerase [Candidatus Protochlamydia naegleriophila]
MAKILITGANGFVGKRLIVDLLNQGHQIYALCRIKGTKVFTEDQSNLHYIWGDLRNPETLKEIPIDIDAAYYLVHSMSDIVGNLVDTEKQVVDQFLLGVKHSHIKQIIYLGGIVNDEKKLSPHLKSRLLVEETLKDSGIPYTVLRASIIIGAGSASFEIIRDLCEKLPIMIAPKWVNSLCQPIAIGDVLFYLSRVLLNEKCMNKTFDIGGPEVFTFKGVMLKYSEFRNLKRWIINVPVLTPRLSSYWLVFITSVRYSLCAYLVESMKTSTVVQKDQIKETIPHLCLTFLEALELAFQKISQNEVVSSWMDSWEIRDTNPDIENYIQVPVEGCLKDEKKVIIKDSKVAAIERIWRIGGSNGYWAMNWAWHLRGFFDRMIGGVGLNRGRRHPFELQVGDSIDFWRVIVADKDKGNLILYAGMKLPGEAWLEFYTKQEGEKWFLIQTATFRPKGILGRLYWYALVPFHFFIFQKMANALAGS